MQPAAFSFFTKSYSLHLKWSRNLNTQSSVYLTIREKVKTEKLRRANRSMIRSHLFARVSQAKSPWMRPSATSVLSASRSRGRCSVYQHRYHLSRLPCYLPTFFPSSMCILYYLCDFFRPFLHFFKITLGSNLSFFLCFWRSRGLNKYFLSSVTWANIRSRMLIQILTSCLSSSTRNRI